MTVPFRAWRGDGAIPRLSTVVPNANMGDENTLTTSGTPEEVKLGLIVGPLLLSACLVAVVFAYRCYSHRARRDRLAQEHQAELREMAGGIDIGDLVCA